MPENLKTINVSDTLTISVKEHVRVEGWAKSKKKGLLFVLKQGDSLHVTEDKWYWIRQLVDRFHKRYAKRIVDPVTGEVIRNDYEILQKHQGHGSAKGKRG